MQGQNDNLKEVPDESVNLLAVCRKPEAMRRLILGALHWMGPVWEEKWTPSSAMYFLAFTFPSVKRTATKTVHRDTQGAQLRSKEECMCWDQYPHLLIPSLSTAPTSRSILRQLLQIWALLLSHRRRKIQFSWHHVRIAQHQGYQPTAEKTWVHLSILPALGQSFWSESGRTGLWPQVCLTAFTEGVEATFSATNELSGDIKWRSSA